MNIGALQQQWEDARAQANALRARFTAAAASENNRQLGPGEIAAINSAVAVANDIKAKIDRAQGDINMATSLDRLTRGVATMSDPSLSSNGRGTGRSLGSQILNSELGQWLLANRHSLPTGQWTSPVSSELGLPEFHATTLTEGAGSGGALVHPDVLPIIVPTPTRPLTIADLCAPGTTTSNAVQYTKETAFTNAAAATSEAGLKPESALVFAPATSPVQKIAHWIPVTEELLEDFVAAQSYLDARMSLGVRIAEEDELLNGNGTAPHLLGFMNLPGLSPAIARGTDINADAIFKQITAIRVGTNLTPSAIIINPANWQSIQLSKLTTGEYASGSSPLAAPAPWTLWGLPCAVTPAIAAGSAMVGCFRDASQIFRRGGLRVEASNSHASFFINNLVAVRAEERLALAVYREAGFGLVTGLN